MFVEEFKARLDGGGARANLFRATLLLQGGPQLPEKTSFLCKAASIPPSDVATVEVPFRGRVVKLAGDRTFQPWNVTVINDTDFGVRGVLEQWMSLNLNSHEENIGDQRPASYKSDMFVEQLDKQGLTLRTYTFVGCWIQNIGEISLASDSSNTVEEFPVVIEYDYWVASGNGGSVR
jgi:hypothetical protein